MSRRAACSYFGFIVLLSALPEGHLSRVASKPSIVDQAIPLLKRSELKRMLGLNSPGRNNPVLPIENVQYKCQILTVLYNYWRDGFRGSPQKDEVVGGLQRMLEECRSPEFQVADFFNQTMIFPGTKWCGQTNVAETFDDLGMFNETDSCCREHDFCDDLIQPGDNKHNLVNPYSTTRLNCECDDALRECFRGVNSVISNTMGYIFFSMLQTQCFKLEYPAEGCEEWRRGSVRMYCVRYKLDSSKPKQWQWFDQAPYY